jgi:hypothetical protein
MSLMRIHLPWHTITVETSPLHSLSPEQVALIKIPGYPDGRRQRKLAEMNRNWGYSNESCSRTKVDKASDIPIRSHRHLAV